MKNEEVIENIESVETTEKYFFEAFDGMNRLAPGSEKSTRFATEYVDKDNVIKVLDLGCGNGSSTFTLSKCLPLAKITCVDNYEPFIENVKSIIRSDKSYGNIEAFVMDINDLKFDINSYDVIWSEGSLYTVGFKKGLQISNNFLKTEGLLICSHLCLLKENISEECKLFWEEDYPEITTFISIIDIVKKEGFEVLDYFFLGEEEWYKNYYKYLEKNLNAMRKKYVENALANKAICAIQKEIDIYKKFNDEFNYVFLILKKK